LKCQPFKHKAIKHYYLPIIIASFLLLSYHENAMAQKENKFSAVTTSMQNQSDYVFNLPFMEDWEYHNFSHNFWQISDNAWIVDVYEGNDGASAKFQGSSNQTNYSSTLTSNWLDGSAVGNDTLTFDLKLSDIAANGTEWLYIKVFDDTGYHTIDSISNNGSFDWTSYTYNITSATGSNNFKVVFDAEGTSSTNILGWYIDNIEVYRACEPPRRLEGNPAWEELQKNYFSYIEWDAPEMLTLLHLGSIGIREVIFPL